MQSGTIFQLSKKPVDTRALTVDCPEWMFGKDFQQQDVQEFSGLLLDALESSLERQQLGSSELRNIYKGVLVNTVTCTMCNVVSKTTETYIDVALPIVGHATIEDALAAFVEPELLEGDNAYSCSRCSVDQGVGTDAVKTTEFGSTPLILVIVFKRFGEKKINDRFVFPEFLDMTPYMEASEMTEGRLYELYGILIHTGSLRYGHYCALFKSVETGAWYMFNDERVRRASAREIEKTFGDSKSSSSAYMVMYRRVTETSHLVENMKMPADLEELTKRTDNSALNVYFTPVLTRDINRCPIEWSQVLMPTGVSVADCKMAVLDRLHLADEPRHLFRLVEIDPNTRRVQYSYEADDEIISNYGKDVTVWLQRSSPDDAPVPHPRHKVDIVCTVLDLDTLQHVDIKILKIDTNVRPTECASAILKDFNRSENSALTLVQYRSDAELVTDKYTMSEWLDNTEAYVHLIIKCDTRDEIEKYNLAALDEMRSVTIVLPPYRDIEEEQLSSSGERENVPRTDLACHCFDPVLHDKTSTLRRALFLVDRRMTTEVLIQRLSSTLKVETSQEQMYLYSAPLLGTSPPIKVESHTSLKEVLGNGLYPSVELQVKIVSNSQLVELKVHLFRNESPQLLHQHVVLYVQRSCNVSFIKNEAIAALADKYNETLVLHMCRLRDLESDRFISTVQRDRVELARIILDKTSWSFVIQPVPEWEKLYTFRHDHVFLFVQEFNLLTHEYGPLQDLLVCCDENTAEAFLTALKSMTRISQSELRMLVANTKFPAEVSTSQMEPSHWKSAGQTSDIIRRIYSDGQLLFYSDIRSLQPTPHGRIRRASELSDTEDTHSARAGHEDKMRCVRDLDTPTEEAN